VKKTINHLAMEFNGKEIEITGYLYSSETANLTGTGTAFKNEINVLKTYNWKQTVRVTEFCDPSILHLTVCAADNLYKINA
jgi:hypothetical protein